MKSNSIRAVVFFFPLKNDFLCVVIGSFQEIFFLALLVLKHQNEPAFSNLSNFVFQVN